MGEAEFTARQIALKLWSIAFGFGLNEGRPNLYCRIGRRSILFSARCSIMFHQPLRYE